MSIRVALARCRLLGLAGTALLAAGGALSGALPAVDPLFWADGLDGLRRPTGPGLVIASFGLTLLVMAWLWLGRLLRADDPDRPETQAMLSTLALWSAPLLVAPPLFSRDVYSYLAQGAMVGSGIDVYRYGPAVLGGPLAAEIPQIWQHTATPYGPVFLLAATAVSAVTGGHVVIGVLGMRLVAVLATALLAVMLPHLARRCGVDPANALWLGVLNPLVLLHLVAGAHNDALMLGFLAAGLAVALDRRPVLGVLLVTLAALVKAPAALGLVFLASIWARQLAGRLAGIRAGLATLGVATGTAAVATAVAGTGFGWVSALRTPVSADNWSVSSTLGRLTELLLVQIGADVAPHAMSFWSWVGMVAVLLSVLVVWLRRDQLGPVYALGLALAAVVLFGPAIRPWYLLWAVVLLAASAPAGRIRSMCVVTCVVLSPVVLPDGFAPDWSGVGQVVLGCAMALALVVLIRYRDTVARMTGTLIDPAPTPSRMTR